MHVLEIQPIALISACTAAQLVCAIRLLVDVDEQGGMNVRLPAQEPVRRKGSMPFEGIRP